MFLAEERKPPAEFGALKRIGVDTSDHRHPTDRVALPVMPLVQQVASDQDLHHVLGFERLAGGFTEPLRGQIDRGLVVPGNGLAVVELAVEAVRAGVDGFDRHVPALGDPRAQVSDRLLVGGERFGVG